MYVIMNINKIKLQEAAMKINKMDRKQVQEALEKASQYCPGSLYERHLRERLQNLWELGKDKGYYPGWLRFPGRK